MTNESAPPSFPVPFVCKPYEMRLLLRIRQGGIFIVNTDDMTVERLEIGKVECYGAADDKAELLRRQLGQA